MAENKKIKEFFDKIAHDWGERAYDSKESMVKFPSSKARHQITVDEIKKRKKSGSILDMGCATGELVIDLLKLGYQVEGFDISPEMIKSAYQNLAKENSLDLGEEDTIFKVNDFQSYRTNKKFDIITAMGFTEYLDSDIPFFEKVKTLLKDGGYVMTDFRSKLFNLFSGNNYTADMFKQGIGERLIGELSGLEEYSPYRMDQAPEILIKTFQDIGEKLPQMEHLNYMETKQKYKLISTQIDIRQSTPKAVKEQAAQSGLKLEYVIYYHFHPFPPMYNKHFPVLFNSLGVAMQPLGYTPLGASMCSSFVAIFSNNSSK